MSQSYIFCTCCRISTLRSSHVLVPGAQDGTELDTQGVSEDPKDRPHSQACCLHHGREPQVRREKPYGAGRGTFQGIR